MRTKTYCRRRRRCPAAEDEIGSEYHRTAFIAPRDDLEEQVGLLAAQRQIGDLVNDRQTLGVNRAMHDHAAPLSGQFVGTSGSGASRACRTSSPSMTACTASQCGAMRSRSLPRSDDWSSIAPILSKGSP